MFFFFLLGKGGGGEKGRDIKRDWARASVGGKE